MPLTGLIDATIVVLVAYVWLIVKFGTDATRAIRVVVVGMWLVIAAYSFGLRL